MSKTCPVELSIIVCFHNMRREAARTLFSLSNAYQKDVPNFPYEVLAVDNGSDLPLRPEFVNQFGSHFSHFFFETDSPSPCAAINHAVKKSRGDYVMVVIDGARILSPGIFSLYEKAKSLETDLFLYTVGMHLGPDVQNVSILDGYNQLEEDRLLETVNWKEDGYKLFEISSFALSSRAGGWSVPKESNCVLMKKESYFRIGGLDEGFKSPGGGFCNLDLFNRANKMLDPVLLLGEATFHQFHGGVATNTPMDTHPGKSFLEEYKQLKGKEFEPFHKKPLILGRLEGLVSLEGFRRKGF